MDTPTTTTAAATGRIARTDGERGPLLARVLDRDDTGADRDLIEFFWTRKALESCNRCPARCTAEEGPTLGGKRVYICTHTLPDDYPRDDESILGFAPGNPV